MKPSADRKRIIATKSYATITKTVVLIIILSVANRIQWEFNRIPTLKQMRPWGWLVRIPLELQHIYISNPNFTFDLGNLWVGLITFQST